MWMRYFRPFCCQKVASGVVGSPRKLGWFPRPQPGAMNCNSQTNGKAEKLMRHSGGRSESLSMETVSKARFHAKLVWSQYVTQPLRWKLLLSYLLFNSASSITAQTHWLFSFRLLSSNPGKIPRRGNFEFVLPVLNVHHLECAFSIYPTNLQRFASLSFWYAWVNMHKWTKKRFQCT